MAMGIANTVFAEVVARKLAGLLVLSRALSQSILATFGKLQQDVGMRQTAAQIPRASGLTTAESRQLLGLDIVRSIRAVNDDDSSN